MATRELELINAMIGTMSEAPLLVVDDGHPFVATCKSIISPTKKDLLVQHDGWWFNRETRTIVPDPETGFIYIPGDALEIISPYRNLTQRGRRLYDTTTGSFVLSQTSVPVQFISEPDLEDLPYAFFSYLMHTCKLRFQSTFDADPQKVSEISTDVRNAYLHLRATHIRFSQVNMANRPAIQSAHNNIGVTGTLRLPLYTS